MKNQAINQQKSDYNLGYDVNPTFSPDGKYIAWQSMARDGYESDRNRLCVYNIADKKKNTSQKHLIQMWTAIAGRQTQREFTSPDAGMHA